MLWGETYTRGDTPYSRVLFCSRYEPLKQTWLSPRLEAAREPRVVWSVRRVSEEGQPLSRAMPTEKWFPMQTVFVQCPVSHAAVAHLCVCAETNHFPVFSSLREWPKINRPHAGFRDTSHILPRPKCQIWTRPPHPTVPDLRPGEYFLCKQYIPENNSRQNRVTSVCCTTSRVEKKRKTLPLKVKLDYLQLKTSWKDLVV